MTKTFTADKFRQNPAPVFRAADKGEKVEITHNHYKDRVFKLTAEDKEDDRRYTDEEICRLKDKEKPPLEFHSIGGKDKFK